MRTPGKPSLGGLSALPCAAVQWVLARDWQCVLCCADLCCRFIKNNLLLELTSNKAMSAFAWLLKRHSFMSYSLYMAGVTATAWRIGTWADWAAAQLQRWLRPPA
jgi:hypothetical protein